VENCTEVHVLCTRSGCDKQSPDENHDWVVLSCSTENISMETSVEMKDTTSPSFDSWLILAQVGVKESKGKQWEVAALARLYQRVPMFEWETEGCSVLHAYL